MQDSDIPARPEPRARAPCLLTRWVFLRLLGLVYLSAFWSLYVQIPGLVGEHGILPARQYLWGVQAVSGGERYFAVPTLAWVGSGDAALRAIAGVGIAASLLVVAGVLTAPSLGLAWTCWLSLVSVGQDFTGFQWDALLLEAGFLAIFFAPATVLPGIRRESPPSRVVLWLIRILLFRLMFFSGVVKLASGDATWRGLTALAYHYQTQPLPTPAAWYAHQLPLAVHRFSAAVMLAIEIVVPCLIFAPRRPRIASAVPIAGLQLLIAATGNFGYFNWLALALCVTLLDDRAIRRLVPARLRRRIPALDTPRAPRRWRPHVAGALAGVVLFLTAVQTAQGFGAEGLLPRPAGRLAGLLEPLHVVNGYGLFAVMTTSRMEIEIQGSDDGARWRTYEPRYKPGDPRRAPGWIDPHMPRLDWQMWFAALGPPEQSPWMAELMLRLLRGRPEVAALFARNPFPTRPPRQVRAIAWSYRFSTAAEKRATGAWWVREPLGVYIPPVSLSADGTELIPASAPAIARSGPSVATPGGPSRS